MKRYAYTLVELLVVIAIIGILVGLFISELQAVGSFMINKSRVLFALFSCTALMAGCTPEAPVGTVKGTASLKGKPYNAASVPMHVDKSVPSKYWS